MILTTARQMKELDQRTIDEFGLPGLVLMENAARGAVQVIEKKYPQARSIAVFCGKGNNGGDGLAMARYFQNKGLAIKIFLTGPRQELRGDAAHQLLLADRLKIPLIEPKGSIDLSAMERELGAVDLVVDALLGTGLEKEVRGIFRDLIEWLNTLPVPKVAVDIPSGLSSDSGHPMGLCLRADLTVTFGLPKLGHLLFPGSRFVGRLFVVDIGLPPMFYPSREERSELLEASSLASFLPKRAPDGHKGSYGHVLVLAGSRGKTGAAALTCLGALRAGAGLVTLGIPESLNPIMEVKLTEAMTDPFPEGEPGHLGAAALDPVLSALKGKKGLALGPGLGTSKETKTLVHEIIKKASGIPLVIDADGLNILAEIPEVFPWLAGRTILTPHPGEMARLSNVSIGEVQSRRIQTARNFSKQFGLIVVLKGARTIIADPSGAVYVNPAAHSVLAAGGTGDVLTGLIIGLVSQGVPLIQSACLGVFLHGQAGQRLAREKGGQGILASEILEVIPRLLSDKTLWTGQDKTTLPLIREISLISEPS